MIINAVLALVLIIVIVVIYSVTSIPTWSTPISADKLVTTLYNPGLANAETSTWPSVPGSLNPSYAIFKDLPTAQSFCQSSSDCVGLIEINPITGPGLITGLTGTQVQAVKVHPGFSTNWAGTRFYAKSQK
jgi:hypothetical protein